MKKLLSLLLCLALCLSCAPAYAAAEPQVFTSGDCHYIELPDGSAEITWYFGRAESLTIPAALYWHAVTSIGDWAFRYSSGLKSVTIPDSVTAIGKDAFRECTHLTLIVKRGSCAAEYCKENGLDFTFADLGDWLNN